MEVNNVKEENTKMEDIKIDVGVYTSLKINLSNFDFTGVKEVILTIKNYASINSEKIVERRFTNADIHEAIITPEESVKLLKDAVYDFDFITNEDKQFRLTDIGNVILVQGVGDCVDRS